MCDAAWSGNDNCSTLAFLPAKMSNGYGHPKQAHRPASSVSSWGAGVVQDQLTKNWIMGVSDYALNCGQSAFPPNQQCGIAVSTTGPDGPYIKNRTMIDPYCEGSSIARDPLSGRWLYLHGGNGVAGYALTHRQKIGPENHCWNCRGSDGVTPTSVQTQFMHQNLSTPTIECPRTLAPTMQPSTPPTAGPGRPWSASRQIRSAPGSTRRASSAGATTSPLSAPTALSM